MRKFTNHIVLKIQNSQLGIKLLLSCLLVSGSLMSNTLYWINGSGNWNDPAHWSLTSGGSACSCTPTATSNVFFDANSFTAASKAVNINVAASCANMDWTGAVSACTLTGTSALNIYGSLTFSSVMNNSFTGIVYFKSTTGTNTITSAGKLFTNDVYFDGINGAWTLQDALNTTTGDLFLNNGILKTNNNNVTCNTFQSNNANVRGLQLGTSLFTVTNYAYFSGFGYGGWCLAGSNYSLDAATSTIKLTAPNYAGLFTGNNDTYYNVIFQDPSATSVSLIGGSFYYSAIFNGVGTTNTTQATFNTLTFFKDGTINGNYNNFPTLNFPQNGTISGNNNSFPTVNFAANGSIGGTNNSFTEVKFNQTGTINSGSQNIGKATFLQNGTLNGNNYFDSLFFAVGKTYTLGSGSTQTINKYILSDGTCSQPVVINSSTAGTQANISSSINNTVNYIRFKDINATGGGVFTANNSLNQGNNSGIIINFPTGQDLYWVGGSGNWNDPVHWSNTSGGAPGVCVPTQWDNVFFDANSFTTSSKAVNINVVAYCANMDWTGATTSSTITGSSDLSIYGSLTFNSTMNNSYNGLLYFKSNNGGNYTITSAGKTFSNNVYIDGVSGYWTLQDDLNTTSGDLYLNNGILNSNNKNITCFTFKSSNNNIRGIILGSSMVTVSGYDYFSGFGYGAWCLAGSNYSLDAGTSTIKCTAPNYEGLFAGNADTYYNVIFQDASATSVSLMGGNYYTSVIFNGTGSTNTTQASFNSLTFMKDGSISGNNNIFPELYFPQNGTISGSYNSFQNVFITLNGSISGSNNSFPDVTIMQTGTIGSGSQTIRKATFAQNATIGGNNIFDTLLFAVGKTYILGSNTTQTINKYFLSDGTCGQPLVLSSSTTGTQANISSALTNITINYVRIKDISATGSGFTANNSTDLGNNSGWTINAPGPQTLYWIGGSGNWNDPNHWSTTSGGIIGGCIPTRYDNVIFDDSSFTSASKAVNINVSASCASMTFTSTVVTSTTLTGSADLNIYGSLHFASTIINSFTGKIYFKSNNGGNAISLATKTLANDVYFDGVDGEWIFQDAFNTGSSDVFLNNGVLNTNGKNFTCNTFQSSNNNVRGLLLGSSLVTVSSYAYFSGFGYGSWCLAGTNYSFDAGTSTIKLTAPNYPGLFSGNYDTYFNVIFQDAAATSVSMIGANSYNNVTFNGVGNTTTTGASFNSLNFLKAGTINGGNNAFIKVGFLQNGTINGNNDYDTLIFTAGKTYTLENNKTQTINTYFKADGAPGSIINITSNNSTPAFISKDLCMLCCSYLNLSNVNATGGAAFYAGSSTGTGNNAGWIFANCPSSSVGLVISKNNVTCFGGNDGSALVQASCGNSPYTYAWSTGDSLNSISNLSAGTYTVTVTDNLGNSKIDSVTITEPAILSSSFTLSAIGLTTTCTNTSAGATSYLWKFGDGNTSNLQNPVYTYNFGGNYTVTLISTGTCGSDTSYNTITVVCLPPVATFTKSINGLMVNFNNTSTNSANTLWDFGDGTTSTSFNVTHTYFNSGIYTACLTVNNGCGSATSCQTVSVTCVPPVVSYSSNTSGMTVTLTNTSTNAGASLWKFGDGQTSTLTNPTHVYNFPGIYYIKLVVSNGCGSDSVSHTVAPTCTVPSASFNFNPQSLSVGFVSTSTNAAIVRWNFGDGSPLSILPFVSHTYATTGTYNVCLTAINGCDTNNFCQTVFVCAPPVAHFVSSSATLTTTFTNTSTNGTNYYWTFGDANASNSISPVYTYSNSGLFNVCLTAVNACGSSTICETHTNYCTMYTQQAICMVTVDTVSTHTIIYWEKPVIAGIDSFLIYREVTTNNYSHIGSVSYDSLSEYHDYAADPNTTSYKYRISLKDTCGNESVWSDYHNTIHLQTLGSGNLQWTLYGIENAGNPVTNYRIYRDNNNTGNFLPISSTIPGGNSTYTDVNYTSYPNANYRVDVAWGITCDPTRVTVNTTRSNIKHQTIFAGIQTNEKIFPDVTIYPNPANESITLEFDQFQGTTSVKIINVIGQIMEEEQLPPSTAKTLKKINVNSYSKGVYTVVIENNGIKKYKKLVVN